MLRLWFLTSLFFTFVFADVGMVQKVEGEAFVVRNNFLEPLKKDDKIKKDDLISTKKASKVVLKFEDNTVVTIGQNSDFAILDYFYDEKNAKKNKVDFFYSKGIFKTLSGRIGKLNRKNYKLNTRTASMGVRGTEIYTKTDEHKDMIACLDGAILVTSLDTKKSVFVKKGYSTTVKPNQSPKKPKVISCDDLDGLEKKDCNKVKADSDKDGVFDFLDECPNTSKKFTVNHLGCPSGFEFRFHFKRGKTEVNQYHEDILNMVDFLTENKNLHAQLIGYTDSEGDKRTNLILSKERAKNVYKALLKHGISKKRLTYDGYGAKDFTATNDTKEGRALNRRIFVRFIKEY